MRNPIEAAMWAMCGLIVLGFIAWAGADCNKRERCRDMGGRVEEYGRIRWRCAGLPAEVRKCK